MALEDFEFKFFEHLKAEFDAGFTDDKSPQAELARTIIQNYKTNPDSLTASDIYALEILILGLQPTERLIQRAPALRLKYRELVGDQVFGSYKPADPPPADKASDPAARLPLVSDLQQLLHFLHWSYLFSPLREAVRTRLIRIAVILILIYTAVWGGIVVLCHQMGLPFVAMTVTVLYCGLIGGFISSQRRLQMVPTTGDPLSSLYDLKNGQYFLWFAPLTGAIFAVVLMAIFIGQVMQGIIFPSFYNPSVPDGTTQQFVPGAWQFISQLLPKSGKDYALLFLWSFIAGFAERLVPDAIDRLTERAQQAEQSPQPTSTGTGDGTGTGNGKGKGNGANKGTTGNGDRGKGEGTVGDTGTGTLPSSDTTSGKAKGDTKTVDQESAAADTGAGGKATETGTAAEERPGSGEPAVKGDT